MTVLFDEELKKFICTTFTWVSYFSSVCCLFKTHYAIYKLYIFVIIV